jgi:hypothetical protein
MSIEQSLKVYQEMNFSYDIPKSCFLETCEFLMIISGVGVLAQFNSSQKKPLIAWVK